MAKHRKHRITHCWQCKEGGLNSRQHTIHEFCGAIICPQCGACGCDNPSWVVYPTLDSQEATKKELLSSALETNVPPPEHFESIQDWKDAVVDYWAERFRKSAQADVESKSDDEDLDLPF